MDLKTRSKILVLFNGESDPKVTLERDTPSFSRASRSSTLEEAMAQGLYKRIKTLLIDSPLEEAMAQGLYKRIKTLLIGRSLEEMKKALEGKTGQYDAVLSNPPYQIMDGGFKACP